MPSLQNAVIDAMNSTVDHHEGYVPYGTYKYIYAKTSEHSLLRQYVVNNYYIYCEPDSIRRHNKWLPDDMLVDLLDNLFPKNEYTMSSFDKEDFYV